MLGTEPVASRYQKEWMLNGKTHLIKTEDGKPMDRRTAVMTLYPRFLYIFSDVVCYVTRNHRAWADLAMHLLDWSMVGAQGSINQHSLPALIIILNGSTLENEAWVSDNHEVATTDFFRAIAQEIEENDKIQELASKVGWLTWPPETQPRSRLHNLTVTASAARGQVHEKAACSQLFLCLRPLRSTRGFRAPGNQSHHYAADVASRPANQG
jgi:hypothetical protein